MVAGGHLIARRGYALYGQIVAGGGFAALYISVFAALSFYALIGRPAAFGLMVLITAGAALAAEVHRSQGLAVFAVAGGFLTPFLVGGGENAQVVLLSLRRHPRGRHHGHGRPPRMAVPQPPQLRLRDLHVRRAGPGSSTRRRSGCRRRCSSRSSARCSRGSASAPGARASEQAGHRGHPAAHRAARLSRRLGRQSAAALDGRCSST